MKVDRNEPLFPEDTANQTKGCRHTNPDICKNRDLLTICAFLRPDGICLKPPVSWPKQYKILKANE